MKRKKKAVPLVLESLTVNNFKHFDSLQLNQLSNINVFVGYNGSGKSSLLEFISLTQPAETVSYVSFQYEPKELIKRYKAVSKSKRKLDYLQTKLKQFERTFVGIIYNPNNVELLIDMGLSEPLPLSCLGGGFIKELQMLLFYLTIPKAMKVLLINDIENSLYYISQRIIASLLQHEVRKNGRQFFITSHSYEFIEKVCDLEDVSVTVFRLEQHPDGSLLAVAMEKETIRYCTEAGYEFR